MRKKTELLIYVISDNVIIYKCKTCGKERPYDKFMLRHNTCPRCGLKWKDKARIIRSNSLDDVK